MFVISKIIKPNVLMLHVVNEIGVKFQLTHSCMFYVKKIIKSFMHLGKNVIRSRAYLYHYGLDLGAFHGSHPKDQIVFRLK